MSTILYKTLLLFCLTFGLFAPTAQGQSVGGFTSGGTVYCSGDNSGFLSLTSYNGTILFWESSVNGGANWTNIPNPTPTQSYLDLTQTTEYRAIVQDGGFPQDTSTISTIVIHVPADGGTIAGAGTFCDQSGTGVLSLSGIIGTVQYWMFSTNSGGTWTQVANTTPSLAHPNITQETWYAAVVENVSTCPRDTSDIAVFQIDPLNDAGTLASSDTLCFESNSGQLIYSGPNSGTVDDWYSSIDNGVTWQPLSNGSNTQNFLNLDTTTLYQVIVQGGSCPDDVTNTVELTVVRPEQVTAGPDVTILIHETTTLTATGNGVPQWNPTAALVDPNAFTTEAMPLTTTVYVVTLIDVNGCTSSDTTLVEVIVPIPSAFTPNSDGKNDFFVIDKVENLTDNTLIIYNRQGNVVYDKTPYDNSWDGRSNNGQELPDGVYFFVFEPTAGAEAIQGYVVLKR